MRWIEQRPFGWRAVVWAAVCVLSPLAHETAAAEEPFRILSPAGSTPRPAILLVPGCSGFVAAGGVNLYDERAAELWAAGYFVVLVDYVGRRMQSNCAHISQAEVSSDILE